MRYCAMTTAILGALLACSFAENHAQATTLAFTLSDHPTTTEAPPSYGLRLDHDGQFNLFHFAGVAGSLETDTGVLSIQGTVWHATQSGYSGQTYFLDALINLEIPADNFPSLAGHASTTAVQGSTHYLALTLLANNGVSGTAPAFNGHRVPQGAAFTQAPGTYYVNAPAGSNSFHIARNHSGVPALSGWGSVAPDGAAHADTQDWLFTLQYTNLPMPTPPPSTPIPEPASVTLVLMGLAGLAWRQRST